MKAVMIIVLTILYNADVFAQTSKYFNVKTTRFKVELISKNGKEIVVEEPADNWVAPKSQFEVVNDASLIVKDVLGVLSEKQVESLRNVEFVIYLGPHLKVLSCGYNIPVKQITDVLQLEDKLNDLSQKYLFRDMKPFFRANDEALFQKAGWVLGKLDRLYNFDPATFPK